MRAKKCLTFAAAAALLAAATGFAQAPEDAEIAALNSSAPAATATPPATAEELRISLEVPARVAPRHRENDLFSAHSWYKAPPPPPPAAAPPPPAPPTAPPLPFTYVGSFQQDTVTVYYLVRGDRAYDVKIGDVLDETYSVDGVSDGQLMLTYLPLAESQGLLLGTAK